MDEVNSLRAKVSALEQANNDRQELLESISGKNKELKDALDAATAIGEKAIRDRDKALEDLAQMKSTLSDTQQTLRAVQEDRDEFAAKMNDAVERAETLQSRCTDLEGICAAKKREISDLLAEKVSLLQESCQLKVECGEFKDELDKAKQDTADLESLKKIIAGFGEAFRFVVEHWGGGGT